MIVLAFIVGFLTCIGIQIVLPLTVKKLEILQNYLIRKRFLKLYERNNNLVNDIEKLKTMEGLNNG